MAITADHGIPDSLATEEYHRLISQRNKAKIFAENLAHTINPGEPDFRRWLRNIDADKGELDWGFLEHYYLENRSEIQRQAATNLSSIRFMGLDPMLSTFPLMDNTYQRRVDPVTELETKLDEASRETQLLTRELAVLRQRAPSLVMPMSGWWAIGILLYIGASSIVLPLSLLPATSEAGWMRPLTVGLFASGLAALMAYIAVEFKAMLRPPDDHGSTPL